MSLKLYNTLTREIETFTPLSDVVKIYTCGPTVYDFPHIGNWRSFIFSDVLRRSLNYLGLKTKSVMNITDVDDKTILGSQKAGKKLFVFTKQYEEAFLSEMAEINMLRPDVTPRATEFIPEMITLISTLLEKGYAEKEEDGIYFSLTKDSNYGRLKKIEKSDEGNFALWKFWKPEDGEVVWDAPFGKGRPGWHIECSAMSMKFLGSTFDIHTGGIDLIFPHHENEIAQSEAVTGKPFVKYWLHSHFVNINSEKMSKSLNNFLTLNDLKKNNIDPLAYRYLVLQAHYQTDLNYTDESVQAAQNGLNNLRNRIASLPDGGKVDEKLRQQFVESLEDNLNTPKALAIINSSSNLSPEDEKATWLEFDKVFGLDLAKTPQITKIPPEVAKLVSEREEARKAQNWALSDTLRTQIESLGYLVKDTDSGPLLTKH